MMIFKRRQVVVLALIVMVVVAGYLQYSYRKSSLPVSGGSNEKLGEAVYVENSDTASVTNTDGNKNDQGKSKGNNKADNKEGSSESSKAGNSVENTGSNKTTGASAQADNFFTQTKMDREVTRGKDTETLKQITNDSNSSKEDRTKAYEQMMKIVDTSQKEMRIENLIKERGYSDAVVLFADDGSIDVVVKSPNITSTQAAQLADIVTRQANVKMDKLHVRNIY